MALVGFRVFAFVAFVEAGDVGHGVGADFFRRFMHRDQRRLQGPRTGLFVALVEGVGLFVGHRARADHGHFAAWGVAGQVELDAAVDLAGADGFGHNLIEGQVQRGVAGLADGRQGAQQQGGGGCQSVESH